jgi:hypothetical protein
MWTVISQKVIREKTRHVRESQLVHRTRAKFYSRYASNFLEIKLTRFHKINNAKKTVFETSSYKISRISYIQRGAKVTWKQRQHVNWTLLTQYLHLTIWNVQSVFTLHWRIIVPDGFTNEKKRRQIYRIYGFCATLYITILVYSYRLL